MRKMLVVALALPLLFLTLSARAEITDPLDPSEWPSADKNSFEDDKNKSAEELILEASILLQDERPLDARSKLLLALQKDPKQYHAHLLLAGYYIIHVGHFRLALKYVKQAQSIFEQLNGKPPYRFSMQRTEHARILNLLSQARLNLDNYQGALETLDEYAAYGYSDEWYPGSRAWVLMKLGRVDEAVEVAKAGALAGAEPGRTLNMLGILLSMTGNRSASLEVFKQAIAYELALGDLGQPATPLNNSGEVYKELFSEPQAESSWLKAISMKDGCEHILPSLNLVLLYIEKLNLPGAKRAMDEFEACIAKFPLRNGEEHRALVQFARGRINLHAGQPPLALANLGKALQHRQWFGKIGTNEDDLRVATLMSYAQAVEVENNHLKFHQTASWRERAAIISQRAKNAATAWWYMRRVRQILIEDLASMEDIYIRNTDSMIEYPTFGQALAALPTQLLEERIRRERKADNRPEAGVYYDLYLAENYLNHGRRSEGDKLLVSILTKAREQPESLLLQHAALLKLSLLSPGGEDYSRLAQYIFSRYRAGLRNYGLRLPVNYSGGSKELEEIFSQSAFYLDNRHPLDYSIDYQYKDKQYIISFTSSSGKSAGVRVKSSSLEEAINQITTEVFTQGLS